MKRSRPVVSPSSTPVSAASATTLVDSSTRIEESTRVDSVSTRLNGDGATSENANASSDNFRRTTPLSRPAEVPERAPAFDSPESDALFLRWRDEGDERARERLILVHRNLVMYLARRFAPNGDAYEDVLQVGMVGLIRALDAFEPERGLRFSTFATPTIAGEIRRYFRDKAGSIRVPRRLHELQSVVAQRIESLTQQLDRSPTYAEIGRALGLDAEEVAEVMELGRATNLASLDEPLNPDSPDGGSIADEIGSNDADLERMNEYSALESALEKLEPRSREVLQMVYFQGFSQAEIARRLNVSQMHISRVQRRALAELRALLDEA